MNQAQFLDSLQHELRDMDAGERAEIVADYVAYFRQAAAAGRRDSEVAAALGSPRLLAEALRRVARVRQPGWQAGQAVAPDRVTSALGVMLGGLARLFWSLVMGLMVLVLTACATACVVAGAMLLMVDLPELGLRAKVSLDIAGHPIADTNLMMATGLAMLLGGLVWLLIDVRLLRNVQRRLRGQLAALALGLRTLR
jgi:uncharacterized membrane protein